MPTVESSISPQLDPAHGRVDLLEDLWFDFRIFRRDARISARSGDVLRTQRYLRASLFSFLFYLVGMVNRWEESLENRDDDQPTAVPIRDRLVRIADRFQFHCPPEESVELLSNLASRCSNLRPSDDAALSRALSLSEIENAEVRILAWLESFADASDLKLHPGQQSEALDQDNAAVVNLAEDDRAYEALGDAAHPFQDPPGTWEELDGSSADGQGPA